MDAGVAILATRRERAAIRVPRERVDGPEVSADPADLFLVDLVEDLGVELASLGGGGGHRHGVLASAQDDVLEDRGHDGGVHRSIRRVRLEALHGGGVEQLRGLVQGRADEVRLVQGQ